MPSGELPVIFDPAGYVPTRAIAFGVAGEGAIAVDAVHPLPIRPTMIASSSSPLAGSTTATMVAGPFVPELGRAIWISLTGSWAGSVTVQRSIDGGATKLPLTVAGQGWASFTANANEVIAEESVSAATYYLAITVTSGTLSYRVQQ